MPSAHFVALSSYLRNISRTVHPMTEATARQLEGSGAFKPGNGVPAVRVLQLEDNLLDAELIMRRLKADGLEVLCRVVADELGFRHALADFAPQIILSDFSLRGFDGLSALEIARAMAPTTPFIFVSGTIGEERAIEALKRGATDYVLKDNLRRLVSAIKNALRQAEIALAKELAEDMLRRSESRLQDIINTSRDWVWECDREGRFTFSSPSIEPILGYTRYEILGRRASDYIDPVDDLQLQATLADVPSGTDLSNPVTLRWRHRNGKTRWLERTMVALRDTDGAWRGVRGIDRDVTLRMAQEVRIRRLNRAQRFLSGASEAAMRIRERDRLIREACRLAVSVGGYARATIYLLPNDVAGTAPLVCSYGDTQEDGAKWLITNRLPEGVGAVSQVLATAKPIVVNDLSDPANAVLLGRNPSLPEGSRSRIALPLCIDLTVIGVVELDAREPGVFGDAELALLKQVAANITFALQYLRSKESAEYLEYYDTLTGLPNRALYLTRVQAALESAREAGRPLAVAVIDIVEFGTVNDNLGQHLGDSLLRLVAERLKNAFGHATAVSRLREDKFSVIGLDPTLERDGGLADRIADCFEAPFSLQGHELRVDARAGFVLFPEDGDHAEALLQEAKVALQHAKDTGARYLRYNARMNETASQRFLLTNELRRAVAEQSFTLHYQPKLNLKSGLVEGVEALLRWSSKSESVPPNVFVPMLESLGLIDEVGSWVIAQAMAETAAWTAGGTFRVAANVSPLQLNREDFAARVLQSIADLGGDPHRLELEVTESTLMADPRHASVSLAQLRAAGVSIAIDDFGTGHSSLRLLAGLPIDVLKIDGSFVRDLVTNRNHRLIVQTTIGLAASLGMKTVAEGVETPEQLDLLRKLGCDAVQGYLVSRPSSAGELSRWFASGTYTKLKQLVAGKPREHARAQRA
jgi:diguanylate cyclase (GGDEF)-like protein/PAS domain S-box-containing protein